MPSTIRPSVCHAWNRRHVEVSGPQLRVLSVDDNSDAAHALAAYLSFDNIECRLAYGGVEAVAIGTDRSPDVIIMDIAMPLGRSGIRQLLPEKGLALTSLVGLVTSFAS
jgi:CheY-like chemotaxis protein